MQQKIDSRLREYIEETVLPRYRDFDPAHRIDHAEAVITRSLALAEGYEVDINMVYAIAAFHDTGLCGDRRVHHLASGAIVRSDNRLREWFSAEEVEAMAQAVEDHRASSDHAPRNIYGMIVAEADRLIMPRTVVERTVQYGLAHYPELDKEAQYARAKEHLTGKYGEGGYLRLWIPASPNAQRLTELRALIGDEAQLRSLFDDLYERLVGEGCPRP